MSAAAACGVAVFVRFRPVNARERSEGGGVAAALSLPSPGQVVVAMPGRPLDFAFDGVFAEDASQSRIYDECARDAIGGLLRAVCE
jgi:hypothetical protein